MTIAAPAIRGLPQASAHFPATTHPIAPLAIMMNATSRPGGRRPWPASAAAAKAAIHVHVA